MPASPPSFNVSKKKELWELLTGQNHIWKGIEKGVEGGSVGVENRLALNQKIQFAQNFSVAEKTEMAAEWLLKRLYNKDNNFTEAEVQAFWISTLGQVSDQGESATQP